ncbi:Hint domain-containing protein [Halovulum sp. GXIMD14794]
MPEYTFRVYAFDSGEIPYGGEFELSGELWDDTFGGETATLVVTDDDPYFHSRNDVQVGELFIGGTSVGTSNVSTDILNGFTWTDSSNVEHTTSVISIDSTFGTYSAILGPIPTEGVTATGGAAFDFDPAPRYDLLCFTRGTMILTERGEVAIEDLGPGDTVLTRDNGAQPIRWIASRTTRATGDMAPIRISKGAIGNDRDLTLSPAHRVLLSGWRAQAICGAPEALATARQLLTHDGVTRIEGGTVEYFHMLLDRHEIVTANGTPAETLNPSDMALDALGSEQRREIETLFPELLTGAGFPLARPMLRDADVAALAATL